MAEETTYRASDVRREASILREQGHESAATLMEELHAHLRAVTLPSWNYLVWSPKHCSDEQRGQWRDEAKIACKAAENLLIG